MNNSNTNNEQNSEFVRDNLRTDGGDPEDSGPSFDAPDTSLEGEELEEHKHPANRRAGTHGSAQVLSEDELANRAQQAESHYGNTLESQKDRETWFRQLKGQLENNAGDENQPVNQFLADARKTGQAELDSEWSFDSSDYLEHDGEVLEFAQEGKGLMEYFQKNSGQIDTLSSQVTQFTGLISNVSEEEREQLEQLESELEEAEQRKEKRISEAEEAKEQEVDSLKDQVANMSEGDLDSSNYEEPNDMWGEEWTDISSSFKGQVEEAESAYEQKREEVEDKKQEVRSDAEQQRETLREHKQDLVEERTDRLDELEDVHSDFATDVENYVSEEADAIEDLVITLRTLENMREDYNENSVAEALEGSAELNQDQQGVSSDLNDAANSLAYRALRRIDNLEDAVSDYAQAAGLVTDKLEEQDFRAGTQLDSIVDHYDDLGLDDFDGEDEYGVDALRARVKGHVENATNSSYDAVAEFAEEIESLARNPS